MGDDSLKDLISSHAKGFVPTLPGLLPFPWDMAKEVPAGAAPPLPGLLRFPWYMAKDAPAGAAPKPPNYLVSKELAAASWVALLLRQPLLLTGDPGVGKTRFAEKLASDLGVGSPAVIQVKSTT